MTERYRIVSLRVEGNKLVVLEDTDAPRMSLEHLQGLTKNLFATDQMRRDEAARSHGIAIVGVDGKAVFTWTIFDHLEKYPEKENIDDADESEGATSASPK